MKPDANIEPIGRCVHVDGDSMTAREAFGVIGRMAQAAVAADEYDKRHPAQLPERKTLGSSCGTCANYYSDIGCDTCEDTLTGKGTNWAPKHARERLAHDSDGDQRTEL